MKPSRCGPDPEIVARVQRAQAGDEQAFSELFEQLQAPVLNYAHQILSDRSSAEDVTQDAFLVAHQRLGMLGPRLSELRSIRNTGGVPGLLRIGESAAVTSARPAKGRARPSGISARSGEALESGG